MRFLSVLVLMLGLLASGTISAQEESSAPAQTPPAEAPKAEMIGQATMAGPRFYRPNTWGMIGANLQNPTDEPANLFFTSWIAPGINTQFGRRVWLPPHSRMRVTHPIFVPADAKLNTANNTGEVETLVIDEASHMETRAGRGSNMLIFNTSIEPSTAHISDPTSDRPGAAVLAARLSMGYKPTTSPMRPDELPTEAGVLEVVDTLIISHRSPQFDADQLAALRSWVNAGGKLWIMLDRVDPDFGQRLLVDSWGLQVIDDASTTTTAFRDANAPPDDSGRYAMTVRLAADGTVAFNGEVMEDVDSMANAVGDTVRQLQSRDPKDPARRISITIEPNVAPKMVEQAYQTSFSAGGRIAETIRVTDEPVRFRRVIADGMEPLFTIDGWPVVLRRAIGRGEVYVTTVDPTAFLTGRDGALPPLRQMAETMLVTSSREALPPTRFTRYVSSQIGYSIASRSTVAFLLFGLVGALIVGGIVLSKMQRLEWLAPLGGVAAVVVTLGFVYLGLASRRSQPLTMSSAGLVEVIGGSQASYGGRLSVYSPEPMQMQFTGNRGGLTLPETDTVSTNIRRLIWTDRHHWQWTGLELRSGDVKSASIETDIALSKTAHATFTFDANGASGVIDGSAIPGFDPQFVANQMLHNRIGGSGSNSFTRPNQLLDATDFSFGALQDTSSKDKQDITRVLVAEGGLPGAPRVIGWADRTELGAGVPDLSENVGATLVTMPLTLVPPPADTQVTVPAVFVRLEAARAPTGGSLKEMFGKGTHGWPGPMPDSQAFTIRFLPPREVMPMNVTSSTLVITSRAPSQTLTVWGYDGLDRKQIAEVNNPLGKQEITINDPALLRTDSEGGIVLTFRIYGEQAIGGELPQWRIEQMGLDLRGTARASTN